MQSSCIELTIFHSLEPPNGISFGSKTKNKKENSKHDHTAFILDETGDLFL